MKRIDILKIYTALWLNKLKILIAIVILTILGLLIYIYKYNVFNHDGMSTMIATLIGTLVGSITTMIGTMYTQRKQSESQAMITKRNTIYKPLYDELAKVKKCLQSNSFPNDFKFDSEYDYNPKSIIPQFGAWERIKSDSRRIQVPKYLDKYLEVYTETVHDYLEYRKVAEKDINLEINKICSEEFKINGTLANVSYYFINSILYNDKNKLQMGYLIQSFINPLLMSEHGNDKSFKLNINEELMSSLGNIIYNKCNKIESVIETRKKYYKSLDELENVIGYLSIAIDYINKKFEVYNHKYF